MPVDDDSDDETVAEIQLENPFIDETDQQPLSPSCAAADLGLSAALEDEEAAINDLVISSQLVTTPYLEQFDLAFNQEYNLVICLPCGAGIPLVSVHTHLATKCCTRMIWQEHKGTWNHTKVILPHQPSVSRLPSKAAFKQAIVESLQEADLIQDQCDILDASSAMEWFESLPKLTKTVPPAVLGLRVFHNAFQCDICGKCSPTENGIQYHYSTEKHGSATDAIHPKTVQTLTENSSYVSYFEVVDTTDQSGPSLSLPAQKPPSARDEDDFIQAQRLLEAKQKFVMPLVKTAIPTSDLRQVLPVYHELRIHEFLSKFPDIRPTLRKPYERQPKNQRYQRLQRIVVETFKITMDHLPRLHNSIRMYITNCTP